MFNDAERLLMCVDFAVPAQVALYRQWQQSWTPQARAQAASEIRRLPLARPRIETDV